MPTYIFNSVEVVAAYSQISACSTAHLGGAITITMDGTVDLTGVTTIEATLGGVSLSGQANVTATTVDFNVPADGLNIMNDQPLVVTLDGEFSNPFNVPVWPPAGTKKVLLASIAVGTPPDGVAATGDVVYFEMATAGEYPIDMDETGAVTIKNARTNQDLIWWFLDASNNYAASAQQTTSITVTASGVGVLDLDIGVGTHMGISGYAHNWAQVKTALDDLGISKYRDEIYWSTLEVTQGNIDPNNAFQAMQDAGAEAGYGGVLLANYGNINYDGGGHPDTDAARSAFNDYFQVLLSNFAASYDSVEIWNEWNLGLGNPGNTPAGTAEDYALLVEALDMPATPEILTGSVGDDLVDWQWTKDYFATGAHLNGDIFSAHLYNYNSGSSAIPEEMITRLERLQVVLKTYNGGQAYPVSITEFGWPTHSAASGVTEELSGAYLARFMLEASQYPWLTGLYIYDLFNDGSDAADPEDNFGLYDTDRTEKAGTPFVKQAIAILKDFVFAEAGILTGTVKFLRFTHKTNSDNAYIIFESVKDGAGGVSLNYQPSLLSTATLSAYSTQTDGDYAVTEQPLFVRTSGNVLVNNSITESFNAAAGGTSNAPGITHGGTINAGAVVVILVHTNGEENIVDNNGATPLTRDYQRQITGNGQTIAVFTRVATASEPAAYNFSIGNSQRWGVQIRVFEGVNTGSIWDVTPSDANLTIGSGGTHSAPSITTNEPGSLALAMFGTDIGSATTYSTISNGFGSELEASIDQPFATYTKALAAAGAIGATTVESDNGSNNFGLSMALRQADAAPTATTTYIFNSVEVVAAGVSILSTSGIRLGEAFTITTDGAIDLTAATTITATLGGDTLTGQANVTANSVDFNCPDGGFDLDVPQDLILTVDAIVSPAFSAPVLVPAGWAYVKPTSINPSSFLFIYSGVGEDAISVGDPVVYQVLTTDNKAVTIADDLTVTIAGGNNGVDQVFTWYYLEQDLSYDKSPEQTVTFSDSGADTTPPVISLTGASSVTVQVGATYTDAGATAFDTVDGDVSANIVVSNTVNTSVVGQYEVFYDVSDAAGNAAEQVSRTVNVVDSVVPVITLNGDATVTHAHGTAYVDAGATATDNYDGSISVTVSGFVNINAVGSYTLTYDAQDSSGNNAASVQRVVNVTDQAAPTITLLGDNPASVVLNGTFVDPGATASDAVDGDVSGSISVVSNLNTAVAGSYSITYNVSDAAGNAAVEVTRTVNVSSDTTAPVITLVGSASVTHALGTAYTDAGATATDNVDGDISSSIVTTGASFDINTAGTYIIRYNVTDSSGNVAAEVTRTVTVIDASAPVITLLGGSVQQVEINTPWSDPGATALDNADGDITASIIVTGDTVDTATPGTYVIYYDVTDSEGNAATQRARRVTVYDPALLAGLRFYPSQLSTDVESLIVYQERDNRNKVVLSHEGSPIDLSVFSRFELLNVASTSIDSDVYTTAFDWSTGGGLLIMDIGTLVDRLGIFRSTLVGYVVGNTEGIVLWEPSMFRSHVSINVVDA